MIQYLKADLWRINRRIPRIIAFVIYLFIGVALILSSSGQKVFNFIKLGDSITSTLQILPIFIAMVNLYFIFEDDFQVKTMQSAIGQGMKRYQIVFVKWFEMFLLVFTDCVALIAVMCITALTKGVTLKGSALMHVISQLSTTCLTLTVITALIMIIIFQIMDLGLTQLLFFILAIKPISMICKYLETSHEILAKLRFSRFLLGNSLDSFCIALSAGRFNVQNFIVIFIYLAIGLGATCLIFRKKELDF